MREHHPAHPHHERAPQSRLLRRPQPFHQTAQNFQQVLLVAVVLQPEQRRRPSARARRCRLRGRAARRSHRTRSPSPGWRNPAPSPSPPGQNRSAGPAPSRDAKTGACSCCRGDPPCRHSLSGQSRSVTRPPHSPDYESGRAQSARGRASGLLRDSVGSRRGLRSYGGTPARRRPALWPIGVSPHRIAQGAALLRDPPPAAGGQPSGRLGCPRRCVAQGRASGLLRDTDRRGATSSTRASTNRPRIRPSIRSWLAQYERHAEIKLLI